MNFGRVHPAPNRSCRSIIQTSDFRGEEKIRRWPSEAQRRTDASSGERGTGKGAAAVFPAQHAETRSASSALAPEAHGSRLSTGRRNAFLARAILREDE